ncbi:uncharacterized protein LOC124316541 [Daphnia pulicaria]|uniref:uncharacterized protein LOC124316541 n=1 Tax=Daphnia pulicaria TaxID=35523 RepID=UPI001EEC17EA|nr:uncharacterized protein LOC124316541 [Daphnia pulicaria]
MDPKSPGNQYESNGYVQSRNKNMGQQRPALLPIQDQINKRFFDGNTRHNFLTRAATFTITSTCTSIAFSSCIPRGNLLPVAPAAVPNCRRKRELLAEDDGQFPINPTEVGLVLSTVLPRATNEMMADDRESTTIEIVSSKEDSTGSPSGANSERDQKLKVKRFFYWPNYISTVTTTTWSVVSTELTRTFVPGVNLDCLPPGYKVCPQAG